MTQRPSHLIRLLTPALALAAAACAAVDPGESAKAQMETMLNTELMNGDSADKIEAFFRGHAMNFTYDPAIRRYAATGGMIGNLPLAVYVYTDTDKKMTVSLVQAPKPVAAPVVMQRERPRPSYLDLPGANAPRNPR